jgi:hypothetical protein
MSRTQYIPDIFVAEHYGLQNTCSWVSKDPARLLLLHTFRDVG